MDTSNYSVYVHTNKMNNKMYIGMTSRSPEKRWNNGYKYNPKFNEDINKYGWDNFNHSIICSGLTRNQAKDLEAALIKNFDTVEYGYNVIEGFYPSRKGLKISEETREKLRESHLGKNLHNKNSARKVRKISTGETYDSLRECCAKNNLNYPNFHVRRKSLIKDYLDYEFIDGRKTF